VVNSKRQRSLKTGCKIRDGKKLRRKNKWRKSRREIRKKEKGKQAYKKKPNDRVESTKKLKKRTRKGQRKYQEKQQEMAREKWLENKKRNWEKTRAIKCMNPNFLSHFPLGTFPLNSPSLSTRLPLSPAAAHNYRHFMLDPSSQIML
jgi:hypothetical protein